MAQMELEELLPKKEALIAKIEVLLIPKDPNDDHDCIVEIRGAAGGDEGNIFAGDLYRMYVRYAETQGWKIQVLEMSESEAGGFSMISFLVKGDEVYRQLKFESGAHRVQRVPKTETQGRIHTSTATVLVLPDAEETENARKAPAFCGRDASPWRKRWQGAPQGCAAPPFPAEKKTGCRARLPGGPFSPALPATTPAPSLPPAPSTAA